MFHIVTLSCLFLMTSCAVQKKYGIGEEFQIPLEGEGDGGFSWSMEENPAIEVVDSLSIGKEKDNGMYEFSKVYVLKGNFQGSHTLKFKKIRSFQPELILDEHIKEITVKIKK